MPAARVIYSALFFVLSMLLIIVAKPRAFFREDGSVRPFGTGNSGDRGGSRGTTVFPLAVVVVVAAVLSLYTFAMIDLVFT